MHSQNRSTVNGKTLNNFDGWYRQHIQKNVDSSGNALNEGDLVFHVSGGRSRSFSIKTVISLREDNTGEEFLGVKLDNGQFSTLRCIDIFKVDANFAKLHSSYVSTKHLG